MVKGEQNKIDQVLDSLKHINLICKEETKIDQILKKLSHLEQLLQCNTNTSGNFPKVEIWVDQNNIINRTEVQNGANSLTWVIMYNGRIVLERNALNETQYEYFQHQPGVYTIYMKDWYNGEYRVISNVISYVIN